MRMSFFPFPPICISVMITREGRSWMKRGNGRRERKHTHNQEEKKGWETILLWDFMVKIKAIQQRTHSFLGTSTDLGNCSFKSSFGNAPVPFMISQSLGAGMPESRGVALGPSGQILGAHCSPWFGFFRQKTPTTPWGRKTWASAFQNESSASVIILSVSSLIYLGHRTGEETSKMSLLCIFLWIIPVSTVTSHNKFRTQLLENS